MLSKLINYINKSIYRKFIFIIVMVSIMTMGLYGTFRTVLLIESTNRAVEEKIAFLRANTSNQFSNPIWHFNHPGIKLAAEAIMKDKELAYIEITSSNGDVLLQKQKTGVAYLEKDIIFFKDAVYSEDKQLIATVTMGYSTYYRNKEILFQNMIFIFSAIIMIFLQIGTLVVLTRKLSKPFETLNEMTSKVANGNLNEKVPILGIDEIGEFSRSFNNMIEKLEIMIGQRDNALKELEENNIYLESKVEERTQDLFDSNQELKLVNEELISTNEKLQETLENLEKTQKKLVRSEKLASLAVLIAGISHEINTPIGTCITANTYIELNIKKLENLNLLECKNEKSCKVYTDSISEANQIIQKSLDKASRLIENLKLIANVRDIKDSESFYIKEALERAVLDVKDSKKMINISIKSLSNIKLKGSVLSFIQIISAFFYNSIIHGFDNLGIGEINIEFYKKDKFIVIEYSDNGKGILKEDLDNIFNPFFTTKMGSDNLGLGLFVVHEIVTLQFEGDVYCESNLGEGSRFTIKIPIEKEVK